MSGGGRPPGFDPPVRVSRGRLAVLAVLVAITVLVCCGIAGASVLG